MPRMMDGSRRSRPSFSGCGGSRPTVWTGPLTFGWMAVFLFAYLVFGWPMPFGNRNGSSASFSSGVPEVRVPEAESGVKVIEGGLEGVQSTVEPPPDKSEGSGESRQDDVGLVEPIASFEKASVQNLAEGQGHNGGGTRYVVQTLFKSAHQVHYTLSDMYAVL